MNNAIEKGNVESYCLKIFIYIYIYIYIYCHKYYQYDIANIINTIFLIYPIGIETQQKSICFVIEVIVTFLRLYYNINSKRTLERRLNYDGFRRRGFSNATINEFKNVIESEIQGPASMHGYRGCCGIH